MIGIRIIESEHMVDQVEDWSLCRSRSRAERRRKQGHRQNVRVISVPRKEAVSIDGGRTMVVHPAVANQLRREVKTIVGNSLENALYWGAADAAFTKMVSIFGDLRDHRSFFSSENLY